VLTAIKVIDHSQKFYHIMLSLTYLTLAVLICVNMESD